MVALKRCHSASDFSLGAGPTVFHSAYSSQVAGDIPRSTPSWPQAAEQKLCLLAQGRSGHLGEPLPLALAQLVHADDQLGAGGVVALAQASLPSRGRVAGDDDFVRRL